MTERAYVTVDRAEAPRIIEVASVGNGGADVITIQDLHDTLNSNTLAAGDPDDSLENMDDDFLTDAAGKSVLGVGKLTGITETLQFAQVAFEGNYTPAEQGTATAVGTTTLTDAGATFISNNVRRGAVILNWGDRSAAEVLEVISETVLRHRSLQMGTNNDWTIGDDYSVINVIQKSVADGNLVAVEADGVTPQDPILPTFCTQVIVESDTSAAQVATSGLTPTQQEIRDALQLAPTGISAAGSIDDLLAVITANQGTQDSVLDLIRLLLQNKTVTNRESVPPRIEVYADNGTLLYTAPIFEDAAGTQPYQGTGIERRERLELVP